MLPLIPIVLAASAAAYGLHKILTPGKKQNLSNQFKTFLEDHDIKPDKDGVYDLNTILPDGDPILFKIVDIYDDDKILKLLKEYIKAGGNLHIMNREGKTAIFYAEWWQNSFEILKEHLDVNARDIYGRTVLFYAKAHHIPRLVDEGCTPLITDAEGKSILFYLSLDDNHLEKSLAIAKRLIDMHPELKDLRDHKGELPPISQHYQQMELDQRLIDAAEHENEALIIQAIQDGANPNCIAREYLLRPLLAEIKYCSINIIELLIKNGADVNASWDNDDSILREYIYIDAIDKIQLLLDHGAVVTEDNISTAKNISIRKVVKLLERYYKMQQNEKQKS